MSPIAPGFQVTSSVKLVRPLRHGGMGSVWVGEHASLHTQVAVKFLSARLLTDPLSRERFSREAAAAAQVKSPYVVQIFDHGVTEEGLPFIVMELLEGEDLTDRIHRGLLSPTQLSKVVVQVARALSRAHAKGIVHRDIKPDNIFLCSTGDDEIFVKLLDFGIAKSGGDASAQSRRRTAHGSMVGTPQYMSPEQAVGAADLDHRADLWSLGMVAYEALTGVHAFEGDTVGALVLEIHHAPLPLPSQRNPRIGASIDQWFQRACARRREERFQSAKELADAFVLAANAPPIKRRPGEEASSIVQRLPLPPDAADLLQMAPPPGLVSCASSRPRAAPPLEEPRPSGAMMGLQHERVLVPPSDTTDEGRLTLAEPVRVVRRAGPSLPPAPSSARPDGTTRGLVAAVIAIAVAAAVAGLLMARGNDTSAQAPLVDEPAADEPSPAQPTPRPTSFRSPTARRTPAR